MVYGEVEFMYENFMVAVGAIAPLVVYLGMGLFMRWYAHFDDKAISNFNKCQGRVQFDPFGRLKVTQ